MEPSNSNGDSERMPHHQNHLGHRQRGLPNNALSGRLLIRKGEFKMKKEYTNQTKQHTVEELAHTAAKRVDIVKIQMVKDKSLLYKYRSICCPNDGYQLMRQFLGDVDREHLVVICLDHEASNQPQSTVVISEALTAPSPIPVKSLRQPF